IASDKNVVRIRFGKAGERVIAVRPWGKEVPEVDSPAFREGVSLWQRAALALPVNYVELTRTAKSGFACGFSVSVTNHPPAPAREHTMLYDSLMLRDDWRTEPLKIAPMPALGSYAIDSKFRGLKFGTLEQRIAILARAKSVPPKADKLAPSSFD